MTLAEYRKRHGLSQRKLAEGLTVALGRPVHHQYIGKWEKHEEKIPADVAAALALDEDERGPEPRPGLNDGEAPADAAADTGEEERPPARPGPHGPVMPAGGDLRRRIAKFYRTLGDGVTLIDAFDGQAIKTIAEPAAEAWAQICKTNETARRLWNFLTLGGAWGDIAWIHAPVVVAILAHHDLLPELRLVPTVPEGPTHGQSASDGAAAPVGDAAAAAA